MPSTLPPLTLLTRVCRRNSLTQHWRAIGNATHVKVGLWVKVDTIGTRFDAKGPHDELPMLLDTLAGHAIAYWAWRGAMGNATDYSEDGD